jgi:hypothetical protein
VHGKPYKTVPNKANFSPKPACLAPPYRAKQSQFALGVHGTPYERARAEQSQLGTGVSSLKCDVSSGAAPAADRPSCETRRPRQKSPNRHLACVSGPIPGIGPVHPDFCRARLVSHGWLSVEPHRTQCSPLPKPPTFPRFGFVSHSRPSAALYGGPSPSAAWKGKLALFCTAPCDVIPAEAGIQGPIVRPGRTRFVLGASELALFRTSALTLFNPHSTISNPQSSDWLCFAE